MVHSPRSTDHVCAVRNILSKDVLCQHYARLWTVDCRLWTISINVAAIFLRMPSSARRGLAFSFAA
jgi:hypothetical protein